MIPIIINFRWIKKHDEVYLIFFESSKIKRLKLFLNRNFDHKTTLFSVDNCEVTWNFYKKQDEERKLKINKLSLEESFFLFEQIKFPFTLFSSQSFALLTWTHLIFNFRFALQLCLSRLVCSIILILKIELKVGFFTTMLLHYFFLLPITRRLQIITWEIIELPVSPTN